MFSNIVEVLNSMRIVKAFCKEEHEQDVLKQINHKYFLNWRRSLIYGSFNVPIGEMSSIFIGVAILFVGGANILNETNDFSFGNFTAFLFAIFSMLHPLKSLTNDYTDLKKAIVSLDRVNEILNLKSEIVETNTPILVETFEHQIEFYDVSFHYKAENPVLKNCNLVIRKGEKVAFVGSSGSGKTTLVNLINRMYDATAGAITIDGVDIKNIKIENLRKLFGVVTQDSVLFTETIENNILYGAHSPKTIDDVYTAAKFAYADEFIEILPDKYQTKILPLGSNLSGGQKQRLCIARAIIENPPILIFDEATSALDTDSEQKVQKAIDMAAGNRTVIIIAHRLSTILSADKIFVLDSGEIVGCGRHADLMENCPKYKHFYDLQFSNTGENI
jgi:ABC-type multidrug transport system fused ATPase/permease subunit